MERSQTNGPSPQARASTPPIAMPIPIRVPPATPPKSNGPALSVAPAPSPSSNEKAPKDLSQVFAAHAQDSQQRSKSSTLASAPEAPRKHKMLGRSLSLHDALSAPTSRLSNAPETPQQLSNAVQKTLSLPISSQSKSDHSFNSRPSSPSRPESPFKEPVSSSTNPVSLPVRPAIRTYSSTRSFIAPRPLSPTGSASGTGDSQLLDDPESQEFFGQRESYSDLRKRYKVDLSSDDDMDTGIMGPVDLKSIGELRDKGENRSFLDELGYLLEGLNSKMTIAVRRLSALKLLENTTQTDYLRRAKSSDSFGNIWDCLMEANSSGDKILDICTLVFATLATRDPRNASDLATYPGVSEKISSYLATPLANDPLDFGLEATRPDDARRLGIGKTERLHIRQILALLQKGDVSQDDEPINMRRLASLTLLSLQSTETVIVTTVLKSLLPELDLLKQRLESYSLGLPLIPNPPSPDSPDISHIDNCLRIIESSLLSSEYLPSTSHTLYSHRSILASRLIHALVACEALHRDRDGLSIPSSHCIISVLRLLVHLADKDREWAVEISSSRHLVPLIVREIAAYSEMESTRRPSRPAGDPEVSSVIEAADDDANRMDVMCLALALLTTLVGEDADVRKEVFQTTISPSCTFSRTCTKDCHCPNRIPSTQMLTSLYNRQVEISEDDFQESPEAAFLKGHLAILIGLLCSNAGDRYVDSILQHLPGAEKKAKLEKLISVVRDFVGLYADLARRFAQALKVNREEDENSMEGTGENGGDESREMNGFEESPGETDLMPAPVIFSKDHQGSQKGVELAERVIGVLTRLLDA